MRHWNERDPLGGARGPSESSHVWLQESIRRTHAFFNGDASVLLLISMERAYIQRQKGSEPNFKVRPPSSPAPG